MKPKRTAIATLTGPAALIPMRCWAELAVPGVRLNVDQAKIANNDTLAWMLLGVLGMTLGMVGACGWGICRRFRYKLTPEQELLDEIKAQMNRAPYSGGGATLQNSAPSSDSTAWEKSGDWWKIHRRNEPRVCQTRLCFELNVFGPSVCLKWLAKEPGCRNT